MTSWRAIPFVRMLIPFLLGLWINQQAGQVLPLPAGLLGLGMLGVLFWVVSIFSIRFRWRWIFGALLFGLFVLIGYVRMTLSNSWQFELEGAEKSEKVRLFGSIEQWKPTSKKVRLTLKLNYLQTAENERIQTNQRVLIYLPQDSLSGQLKKLDQITVSGRLQRIPGPRNPEAFDLQQYYFFQKIRYQVFVKEGEWEKTGREAEYWLSRWRSGALEDLSRYVAEKEAYAILAAMLLGNRDNLEDSVRNLYADTGAIHVLAVSGLHVGLIYMLAAILTGRKPRKGFKKWVQISIQLSIIWFYAFLTGASPSVVRAATMFSFVGIGHLLGRRSLIYNTLAASAFVMLLRDPYLLWQIGFQLSYLAVGGIVFFQPKIERWWHPSNQWIRYGWQLVSVSLAAQLTTFPLSLYYFHQFPTYFWLSGLIVIPVAPMVIGGGILLLFTQLIWTKGAFFLGKLLEGLLWLTNTSLSWIQHLPFSTWKNIWLESWEALLLYGLIGCVGGFWHSKSLWWIKSALVILLIWSVIHLPQEEPEMVVYEAGKELLIDLFTADARMSIQKDTISPTALHWIAGNYRMKKNKKGRALPLDTTYEDDQVFFRYPFLQLGEVRIFFLDEQTDWQKIPAGLSVDYLVLSGAPEGNPKRWQEKIQFREIWIASRLSFRIQRQWEAYCREEQQPCRQVYETGAIRILY